MGSPSGASGIAEAAPHGVYMIVSALAVIVAFAGPAGAVPSPPQSAPSADCKSWQQCRQMALDAAERGEYERFHDLAWRAVQTGDRKDPALMYLLARAQSLSGRPHDALVMLQRLAEMGVPSDAATNEDFRRTRELPGWPELAARIERLEHPDTGPARNTASSRSATVSAVPIPAPPANPATRSAPPPPPATPPPPVTPPPPAAPPSVLAPPPVVPPPASVPAPAAAAPVPLPLPVARPGVVTPAPVAEAVRFSTAPFSVGGLAYDAVSRRFLFGDRLGRKLIVVGEGSNQTSDLVHGDSAGFREISAVEIDARRGDLWVATAADGGGAGTLHRLQLVSGRPLKAFPIDPALEPVTLADLAVTPNGAVLVLDSTGRQLLTLRAGTTSLESVVRISEEDPVSIAASDRDGVAYVAHRNGASRIDLRARTASPVAVPKGMTLGHLERIRWYRNALIALTVEPDDTRRIVRLDLNSAGTAITRATTLEESVPTDVQSFVTISGDDLIYVASGSSASSPLTELVAYRVHLR